MKSGLSLLFAVICLMVSAVSAQEGGKPKLVLEKITYEKPAFKNLLAGGDELLLEKLVHAKKYTVMDRDAVDAYLREKGIAGDDGAGLASGDRTLFARIIDCTDTGKIKILPGNKKAKEYIVRLTMKISKMEEKLEVETIENERIEAACVSTVDLLDVVISKLARKAVFAVDFANPEITDVVDGEVEVDYGRGFMFPGEIYDIRTGAKGLRGRKTIGQIQITEIDKEFSTGRILSGDIQKGYKLRVVDGNAGASVVSAPMPTGVPQIVPPVQVVQALPAAPPAPGVIQGTSVLEANPNATSAARIGCVVSHFDFASDFKGVGYRKKSFFDTVMEIGGTAIEVAGEAKRNGGRRSRRLAELALTAVPEAADAFFGDGIPVNFNFKPEMKKDQKQMLEVALGSHSRFDVRQYDVKRLGLDNALARGVTHVIDGSIRGVHINVQTGKTTFIFALKLVDISNNNTIVSNQDRIVVECNGYEEPDTYEEATKKAVAQFATTF